jgi:prolyl-tRNA synthetase
MRQSQLFGKTVKTIPKDITAISHKLLYKGGFIRQISAGRYAFLPLGYKVVEKISKVIDDEMRALGAMRVETPTLHPIELWKATNRDKAFGDEMLIVEDHHGSTFAIGATAEGLMTELVKQFKPSYKDLPVVIYQFVQKFRDEKRPRGGLLRVREFMMKDAYSFHETEKELLHWYQKFYDSYIKIAKKLELETIPVQAHSGAIGGDYNHEFMVESEVGEDTVLLCDKCDYAANIEMAESVFNQMDFGKEEEREMEDVLGKGLIGVEPLAKYLNIPVEKTTKTLLYMVDLQMVAVAVRGDYNISETKLARLLHASTLTLASEKKVKEITGAEVGYAGPLDLPESVKVIWDLSTKGRKNFEAGANKTNYHTININFGSDLPEPEEFFDIREVKENETCVNCKEGKLNAKKVIEFGHVFKQDHFYTGPMGGNFIDKDGQEKPMWMGAYGIGVGRAMATVVETHNDERGIIWPENIAPFGVHLIQLRAGDLETSRAKEVYEKLKENNIDVLWDDRNIQAGEKFADADLIGIPARIVVSDSIWKQVGWKLRTDEEEIKLPLNEVLNRLK